MIAQPPRRAFTVASSRLRLGRRPALAARLLRRPDAGGGAQTLHPHAAAGRQHHAQRALARSGVYLPAIGPPLQQFPPCRRAPFPARDAGKGDAIARGQCRQQRGRLACHARQQQQVGSRGGRAAGLSARRCEKGPCRRAGADPAAAIHLLQREPHAVPGPVAIHTARQFRRRPLALADEDLANLQSRFRAQQGLQRITVGTLEQQQVDPRVPAAKQLRQYARFEAAPATAEAFTRTQQYLVPGGPQQHGPGSAHIEQQDFQSGGCARKALHRTAVAATLRPAGNGSRTTSAEGSARNSHQVPGCADKSAKVQSALRASAGQPTVASHAARSTSRSARCRAIDPGHRYKTVATSSGGTRANENTGMATAFTTGPISEKLPKIRMVTGSSATVTTHCTRAAVRREPPAAICPPARNTIADTAQNESQNPALRADSGSNSSTPISETATLNAGVVTRPRQRAARNAASITAVRCAGTEKPDSSA